MLSQILPVTSAIHLEQALKAKARRPILQQLDDPVVALRYMRSCLRGSYLFGRTVVPAYLSNVFSMLTECTPANDATGKVVRGLMEMCIGELCTNNIFGRPGESHSHFHDLFEAYGAAGGDVEEFNKFMADALNCDVMDGIDANSNLWSEDASWYASELMEYAADPLCSFILMPCNELLTTIVYPVALCSLSKEARFDKFRRFMEVHVQLDGDEHGQVAEDWLELYIREFKINYPELEEAAKKVLLLYKS